MGKLADALLMTGGSSEELSVEAVFSTYVYTGTGVALDIVNGIDLENEGGMVWCKDRGATGTHFISDTERLITNIINSDLTNAERTIADLFTSHNSNGFTLGSDSSGYGTNLNNHSMVSWTFRKAPRFFDVVKYTGNGVAGRQVAHDLGVAPGMIIVKRLDIAAAWQVYHRSNTAAPETDYLVLNETAATVDSITRWNDTTPTDALFTLGDAVEVNANAGEYIAYLFAHDPEPDGMIQCGTTVISGGIGSIDLGWEPQYLLMKLSDSTGDWDIHDVMRGTSVTTYACLDANTSGAEQAGTLEFVQPTPTGVDFKNQTNGTYIYMAIRRPMKTPTVGTEVFAIDTRSPGEPQYSAPFPVDMVVRRENKNVTANPTSHSRLTWARLYTNRISAEDSPGATEFDFMDGYEADQGQIEDLNDISWMWKRSPGFFDVVAYTGTGVAGRTVDHNLTVVPELIIIKNRTTASPWPVYCAAIGNDYFIKLNESQQAWQDAAGNYWDLTSPTDIVFSVGSSETTNGTAHGLIAYLFATLAGVSKVGSYTGDGTTGKVIDCGFSTGARFILIKRTDSTGDWFMWDSVRGITTGNCPHLSLNTTAAQVTTDDSVDPEASGFIVNQVAATNINVLNAEYIFYAIS